MAPPRSTSTKDLSDKVPEAAGLRSQPSRHPVHTSSPLYEPFQAQRTTKYSVNLPDLQVFYVHLDADASLVELCEKMTDSTQSLCPSNVCRQSPLLVFQILTVRSPDAEANRDESRENDTEFTDPLCPSSGRRHALHSSLITGCIVIHFGASCLKRVLIRLRAGLNRSADAYP
jgi:hypothetical protein